MKERKIHGYTYLTDGQGKVYFKKGWKAYRKDMQRTAFGEWSDTGLKEIEGGELGISGLRRLSNESKLFFENEKGEKILI
jgi:hypothetical protein